VAVEQECFNIERQQPDSRIAPRLLCSIPDSEAATKLATAPPRIMGELLPPEDEDDNLLPETSPFTQGRLLILSHLSDEQGKEIDQMVTVFSDCFNDGKMISHMRDYSDLFHTGNNHLPPPQSPWTTGQAKRTAIDKVINEPLQWDVIEP
jgi:hypothetical protein